jgi:hypothetical protein
LVQFWLKCEEDPDPTKAQQYARWREFRKLRDDDARRTDPTFGRPEGGVLFPE